jgi:23S rRNA (uracil1939-C5)-methyltransferase
VGRRRNLPSEPFELDVGTLDAKGTATGTHEGRSLRVWGALPGERVQARYLFGRRFRGQAETVDVLEASRDRVSAPCPSFGTCSACTLQHLSREGQLAYKQQRLLETLAEQAPGGALRPARVLSPLDADRWHYRRKARLSVREVKGKGRVLVGFRERDGRFVTDMQACHTLFTPVADALPELSELIGALDAAVFIPQIEAACGDDATALVLRHLEPLGESDRDRLKAFEADSGFRWYLQPKGPDTVAPLVPGTSRLSYTLPGEGLTFEFEPLDFIQVNQSLNERMIAQAMDLLAVEPGERVLDLFCGIGNFSLPLARRGADVLGLEGSPELVRRAEANARRNGVDSARFSAVDLYGEAVDSLWPGAPVDAVLLDPPRSGAGPVLARIAATEARRVLYVSCNPDTLASDATELVRMHGYRLAAAGAMDMFPQTTHIEAMALFERP